MIVNDGNESRYEHDNIVLLELLELMSAEPRWCTIFSYADAHLSSAGLHSWNGFAGWIDGLDVWNVGYHHQLYRSSIIKPPWIKHSLLIPRLTTINCINTMTLPFHSPLVTITLWLNHHLTTICWSILPLGSHPRPGGRHRRPVGRRLVFGSLRKFHGQHVPEPSLQSHHVDRTRVTVAAVACRMRWVVVTVVVDVLVMGGSWHVMANGGWWWLVMLSGKWCWWALRLINGG